MGLNTSFYHRLCMVFTSMYYYAKNGLPTEVITRYVAGNKNKACFMTQHMDQKDFVSVVTYVGS